MMKKTIIGVIILGVALFFGWIGYLIYIGNTCYMGHKTIGREVEGYELIWGSPYGGFSSLGYTIYDEIDSLKSVKWNDRMIIVEQNIDKENRWAIIKPKSDMDTLLDRMKDTLIRDLTKYEIDSIVLVLKADSFVVEDLKPDIIERCYQ